MKNSIKYHIMLKVRKGDYNMAENIHKDHRKRVRKEFLEKGFNINTPNHKIMEMLLFYGIAQKDTNEIAHRLINYFGSFEAVLEADAEELQKVEGIGENCAALIKLVHFISEYYLNEKSKDKKIYTNLDEICEMVANRYINIKKEKVAITCLDNGGKVLGFDFIGEGDIASVGVSIRKVIEIVLKRNAASIILSHNHPGGTALPSKEDIEATETLVKSLNELDVGVLDHIIIADNDYVSLRQSYQYGNMFKEVEYL